MFTHLYLNQDKNAKVMPLKVYISSYNLFTYSFFIYSLFTVKTSQCHEMQKHINRNSQSNFKYLY